MKMVSTHELCARMDLRWDGLQCHLSNPLFGEVKDALRTVGMVAFETGVPQHDWDVLQDDLKALLRALELFDGARPLSPHEVMLLAIARAEIVVAEYARYRLTTERLLNTLTEIHGFLLPENLKTPDGHELEFRNAVTEHEMLRGLSDAIRSIPKRVHHAMAEP